MRRALLIGLLIAAPAVSAQQLPPGAGADVLKSRCVICHEADIITSQKLSLAGWTRSVDKMVRWGSAITPQERDALQPYLAEHFGVAPVASHAVAAAEATFKKACLVCHDNDIIEQQKLSKTGWTRSVEKMMRWGAAVSEADKQPLIDHLASKYPPR